MARKNNRRERTDAHVPLDASQLVGVGQFGLNGTADQAQSEQQAWRYELDAYLSTSGE